MRAHLLRGRAYNAMGELDLALRRYKEALELDLDEKEIKAELSLLRLHRLRATSPPMSWWSWLISSPSRWWNEWKEILAEHKGKVSFRYPRVDTYFSESQSVDF